MPAPEASGLSDKERLVRSIHAAEQEILRLKILEEESGDAVVSCADNGTIATWNPAGEEIFGYSASEAIGTSYLDLVPSGARSETHALLRRAHCGERIGPVETERLHKNGNRVAVTFMAAPLRDAAGQSFAICIVHRDLSALRRAEQVSRLTAIGQLTAGIIHEIKNPVAFVQSNLGFLERCFDGYRRLLEESHAALADSAAGNDGIRIRLCRVMEAIDSETVLQELPAALEETRKGMERIRDTVNRVKDFGHIEEGELRPSDLRELLEQALRFAAPAVKPRTRVERRFGEVPPVTCHPLRIEQAFANLLINAADAIPDRGTITVAIGQEGGEAVVRIRDTGQGIPAEHLPRIFEPFFTTKPDGTGLGLHVVHKIVHAHGGRVDVGSRPGEGTEFAVRLPIGGPR